MLFGRHPHKEKIPLSEMETYLDRCFDGELKRLSARLPEIETSLSRSRSAFETAIKEFSKSESPPDTEYLYGVKEAYLKSHKINYSSSLLHTFSSPIEYGGANLYGKGEELINSYQSFITTVLKVNNTFKLVMIGYSGGLADVKRHFTSMERLCKDLKTELDLCSPQKNVYQKLSSKINTMLQTSLEIAALQRLQGADMSYIPTNESEFGTIKESLEEKKKKVELARHRHHEAENALSNLLLPIERAARKHDHLSASKIKLTDYIKAPEERIRTAGDVSVINRHLDEIEGEIREGKIEAKNTENIVSRIAAIRSSDLLGLAESCRMASLELKIQRLKARNSIRKSLRWRKARPRPKEASRKKQGLNTRFALNPNIYYRRKGKRSNFSWPPTESR
jgi:hypothetical protein